MARIVIPDTNTTIEDTLSIKEFLKPHGIYYDHYQSLPELNDESSDEQILRAYDRQIEELKRKGQYVTADVINVSPATQGLDTMLAKFSSEHTHSEDEVRFVVKGRGIFHINPQTAPVFSIEMVAGDLINVPAGTRHWFNLCAERTIRTIRLFQDTTGWTPHYVEGGVAEGYSPLCFGDRRSEVTPLESVVKP